MFSTPLDNAVAFVPGQVIPDEQDSDGRKKAIQLLSGWIDIPILPTPTNGDRFGNRRTLFQNGSEFALQPGMQNGIGTLLGCFGAEFSRGRPKQGEQFRGFSPEILMGLACRPIFDLPGTARLRDGLIRTSLVASTIPGTRAVRRSNRPAQSLLFFPEYIHHSFLRHDHPFCVGFCQSRTRSGSFASCNQPHGACREW